MPICRYCYETKENHALCDDEACDELHCPDASDYVYAQMDDEDRIAGRAGARGMNL